MDLRECCDEQKPLKSANRVKDEEGITELIKLFDKYSSIEELRKSLKDAEKKQKTYNDAVGFSQISAPKNITEYKSNNIKIENLENELIELSEKSNSGLLDLDGVKAQYIYNIRSQLSKLYRQRTRLKNRKSILENEKISLPTIKDFSDLV